MSISSAEEAAADADAASSSSVVEPAPAPPLYGSEPPCAGASPPPSYEDALLDQYWLELLPRSRCQTAASGASRRRTTNSFLGI